MTDRERIEKALTIIWTYGQVSGSHHKMWVIDQILEALADDYDGFVQRYENDGDYEWETGRAP